MEDLLEIQDDLQEEILVLDLQIEQLEQTREAKLLNLRSIEKKIKSEK